MYVSLFNAIVNYHVHGARLPSSTVLVASSPRSEGRGRDSVVLEPTLQYGPQWAMKNQGHKQGYPLPNREKKCET